MGRNAFGDADRIATGTFTLPSTISGYCWCKNPANAGNRAHFLHHNAGFVFSVTSANLLELTHSWADGPDFQHRGTCSPGTMANWQHYAFTYDGANATNNPVLYVDAVSQTVTGSGTTGGAIGNPTAAIFIGAASYDWNQQKGTIGYAGIHNVVLTAAEIAQAKQFGFTPRGLVGFWPLLGDATPEPDFSGLKRNGTVTGTTVAPGPPVFPSLMPRLLAA